MQEAQMLLSLAAATNALPTSTLVHLPWAWGLRPARRVHTGYRPRSIAPRVPRRIGGSLPCAAGCTRTGPTRAPPTAPSAPRTASLHWPKFCVLRSLPPANLVPALQLPMYRNSPQCPQQTISHQSPLPPCPLLQILCMVHVCKQPSRPFLCRGCFFFDATVQRVPQPTSPCHRPCSPACPRCLWRKSHQRNVGVPCAGPCLEGLVLPRMLLLRPAQSPRVPKHQPLARFAAFFRGEWDSCPGGGWGGRPSQPLVEWWC